MYTPIHDAHGAFVHNDYKAAYANHERATWLVKDARKREDTAGEQAALDAYRQTRAILLDVRQHVTVAGGHPEIPEL